MNERYTHIDLFAGIGGFALAARANGIRTIQFVEIDQRCRNFLAATWPGVAIHDDIKTFRWSVADANTESRSERPEVENVGLASFSARHTPDAGNGVFLLTAGVPCQPASRAGKQRGAADDRWLWPDAIRVLGEVRPTWAIFENPPGIGDVGLAGILSDVESKGYEVRVFSIPACAVGTPHGRERYYIVCRRMYDSKRERGRSGSMETGNQDARDVGAPSQGSMADPAQGGLRSPVRPGQSKPVGHNECAKISMAYTPAGQNDRRRNGDVAEAEGCGGSGDPAAGVIGEGMGNAEVGNGRSGLCDSGQTGERGNVIADASQWQRFVWLPCADGKVRRAPDDAFSLVDGLHRSVLAALGNSIVPQVAAELMRMIMQIETEVNDGN
jgi:DNA (cytosine-5)-methyltransferase 1